MSETNKSYRIKTEVGTDKNLTVKLEQDYNTFEILSLQLNQEDTYRLQTVGYGVVVGRVLANGGFGIPNAKISVFIESEEADYINVVLRQLYPYKSTRDEVDYRRYNLLPDKSVDDCHRAVGSFPNKTYVLDNDDLIEIFDKYYKYTTRTNNSGDFIICGVPTGMQTIHMDLDLSDCGILSQKPRDFYYKGYTVEQFENPNQFKVSNNIDSLSQIFTQDQVVNVIPFWGDNNQGDTIGVTRCDIDVNFKFEPTCVFIGSIISDSSSKGISKKCIATNTMGAMDELVTGEGTIEMIRKTVDGNVEEFQIKGTELINANGVWCYQIPMNLDYMVTDEYGNMVPTDNPNKGIPTRTSVRFRVSMHDTEENTDNYFLSKVLVPNNPQNRSEIDFNFGTATKDTSYRDLFWNNVYTVKSYIPRFQKSQNVKNERFTGIKHCNIYGNNNPIPYNNIRIRLPLMFTMLCALIKSYTYIVKFINKIIYVIAVVFGWATTLTGDAGNKFIIGVRNLKYIVLSDGLCPDLDNWYFAPGASTKKVHLADSVPRVKREGGTGWQPADINLFERTYLYITNYYGNDSNGVPMPKPSATDEDDRDVYTSTDAIDETSVDYGNRDSEDDTVCLTNEVDYLTSCIEMNLAQEHKVINFDFYNDWLNGTIYLPRWNKFVTKKKSYFFGLLKIPAKIKGCLTSAGGANNSISFKKNRRYTQQCALSYGIDGKKVPTVTTVNGCDKDHANRQKCHGKKGFRQVKIFGKKNGGIIQEMITSRKQYVYYAKPCEWQADKKVNLFATDIVLLGSLDDCNRQGLPQAFKHLSSSSYQMPTNLALTNMDDDGYLYATTSGTMCAKSGLYSGKGATSITGSTNSFSSTKNYYGSDNIKYYENEDRIPMTEAAGISWNYTGPDQGDADFSKFYQPGGHSLGISCTNSETNIKSCVNLTRACEAGSNLSQRRELVSKVSSDGTLKYKYYIPTGLISKDDIIDQDFRTMFATMNHTRLIADSYDIKTGYLNYSFSYKRPTSFDGSVSEKLSNWYNRSMSEYVTIDQLSENDQPTEEDLEIKDNSYTRTLEASSRDYYFFRLGIDDFSKEKDKYLITGINNMLPQFENSFYFYFGLRPGATALDELNKQFFANCEINSVDDSGGEYVYIEYTGETEIESYALMNRVPQNPTEEYPQYIKVGDTFYELKSLSELESEGEGDEEGGGDDGGDDTTPPSKKGRIVWEGVTYTSIPCSGGDVVQERGLRIRVVMEDERVIDEVDRTITLYGNVNKSTADAFLVFDLPEGAAADEDQGPDVVYLTKTGTLEWKTGAISAEPYDWGGRRTATITFSAYCPGYTITASDPITVAQSCEY